MLISETGAFEFAVDAGSFMPAMVGKRVLVTGVTSQNGVDIARSYVEAGARVILQCDETSPAMQAMAELLAPQAAELSVHAVSLRTSGEIVAFARAAAAEFGGLDMVVNIVDLDAGMPPSGADFTAVEAAVSDVLLKSCLVARVAANRMRLTMTDGVVLTVATFSDNANASQLAFAQVARSTLVSMTRREAEAWADQGIRFYAVAPDVSGLGERRMAATETDVAQLALFLAAGKGASLSGVTLEMN